MTEPFTEITDLKPTALFINQAAILAELLPGAPEHGSVQPGICISIAGLTTFSFGYPVCMGDGIRR